MDQQEQYKIHLKSFEGPMDLLLHLIEKNRIDIYDIPIAILTEQYMAYLAKFRQFNIEVASEFLVMAATLLQIKSRLLLPDAEPVQADEEDDESGDPRRELVERLLEYRRYKEVSALMKEMAEEAGRRFFRAPDLPPMRHLPPGNMSVELLYQAFKDVLAAKPEAKMAVVNVARRQYTIEDKIESLIKLLEENSGSVSFAAAIAPEAGKEELITTFLAMLELIKLKRITVYQTGLFAPIYLKLNNTAAVEASALKS